MSFAAQQHLFQSSVNSSCMILVCWTDFLSVCCNEVS